MGPFTDGNTLKSTLRFLRRIFPYCTCKNEHNNFCLNYHIGKCPGVCCLKHPDAISNFQFSISSYNKNITAIKNILNGKRVSLVKNLEKEMTLSAKRGNLEKAIELREILGKLKRVFENAQVILNLRRYDISKNHNEKVLLDFKNIFKLKNVPTRIEGYDISNIQGNYATGSMVVFTNGKPDKNQYRK